MTVKPHPVQVRFSGTSKPDIVGLNTTLIPYARMSGMQIAAVLPVEVHWPDIVADRIAVLELYTTGGAPPGTTEAAVQSIRNILRETIPKATDDVVRAVRLTAAAAIRDDGSRAVSERTTILAAYLEAKALAMVRTLDTYELTTEPAGDWGEQFAGLGLVFSPGVIYGLAMIAPRVGTWAGWTDADLWIGDLHPRIWAPILADAPNHWANREFTPEEIRLLFVPQLLEHWQVNYEMIRDLIFGPWTYFKLNLSFRDERFLDLETIVDQSSSGKVIAHFVANRILQHLIAAPAAERARLRMELATPMRSHGIGVYERLKEMEQAAFGAPDG